jgi:hypothetical protein
MATKSFARMMKKWINSDENEKIVGERQQLCTGTTVEK